MNNFNNYADTDNINSQLERAGTKKSILIRNIYKEYALYLNIVRDLLYISTEEGLNNLCSYSSIKEDFFNAKELFPLFEKKIRKLIFSKLPLITLEQLKIIEIDQNINKFTNTNSSESSTTTNDAQ